MAGDCRYSAGNQSVANIGTLDAVTDRPDGGGPRMRGSLKVIWEDKQWD